MILNSTPPKEWRVRLVNQRAPSEKVIFDVSPEFMESRTVNYRGHEPIHAPGQMTYYINTASRTFNISQIKLVSRTPKEADETIKTLHLLRGWTMPYFGEDSTLTEGQQFLRLQAATGGVNNINPELLGSEYRGMPPDVLLLSAYSNDDSHTKTGQHISKVPTVITNLSIPYPKDCDYIPSETHKVPVPTLMMVDISLSETHSPEEYEGFNLGQFKKGLLGGF